jgi:hypothetical protein
MAPIAEVASAIDRALGAAAKKPPRNKKAAPKPVAGPRKVTKAARRKKPAGARSGRDSPGRKSVRKTAARGKSALRKGKSRRG